MHRLSAGCLINALLLLGCHKQEAARPELPAAYGDYRHLDNTLVFQLPDTGGYIANGQPLDTGRLGSILHEVVDSRKPHLRAAIVFDNPRRPWSDVEYLAAKAQSAGVKLFDGDRSGWRRPDRVGAISPIQ